jgi:hypothetical protein
MFSSAKRADQLSVSGVLPPEERGPGLYLTTHFHIVPRSRMSEAITPPPVCLHGLHRDSFTLLPYFTQSGGSPGKLNSHAGDTRSPLRVLYMGGPCDIRYRTSTMFYN